MYNFLKPKIKEFTLKVLQDIFYISLITFVIFLIIELTRPRFVSSYINMNILLIIVIVSGIVTIIRD